MVGTSVDASRVDAATVPEVVTLNGDAQLPDGVAAHLSHVDI